MICFMRALNAKLSNHTLYVRTLNCLTPKHPVLELDGSDVAADFNVDVEEDIIDDLLPISNCLPNPTCVSCFVKLYPCFYLKFQG